MTLNTDTTVKEIDRESLFPAAFPEARGLSFSAAAVCSLELWSIGTCDSVTLEK